jgi:hypothetical protein
MEKVTMSFGNTIENEVQFNSLVKKFKVEKNVHRWNKQFLDFKQLLFALKLLNPIFFIPIYAYNFVLDHKYIDLLVDSSKLLSITYKS